MAENVGRVSMPKPHYISHRFLYRTWLMISIFNLYLGNSRYVALTKPH